MYPVGSDTIKTTLFGRLRHSEPGEGFLHFHMKTGADYFEQLTAEKQALVFRRGYPERVWVKKPSARNEALDCLVYAYAGLNRLYQRYDRRTIWDQLERRLEKPVVKERKAQLRSDKSASFTSNW